MYVDVPARAEHVTVSCSALCEVALFHRRPRPEVEAEPQSASVSRERKGPSGGAPEQQAAGVTVQAALNASEAINLGIPVTLNPALRGQARANLAKMYRLRSRFWGEQGQYTYALDDLLRAHRIAPVPEDAQQRAALLEARVQKTRATYGPSSVGALWVQDAALWQSPEASESQSAAMRAYTLRQRPEREAKIMARAYALQIGDHLAAAEISSALQTEHPRVPAYIDAYQRDLLAAASSGQVVHPRSAMQLYGAGVGARGWSEEERRKSRAWSRWEVQTGWYGVRSVDIDPIRSREATGTLDVQWPDAWPAQVRKRLRHRRAVEVRFPAERKRQRRITAKLAWIGRPRAAVQNCFVRFESGPLVADVPAPEAARERVVLHERDIVLEGVRPTLVVTLRGACDGLRAFLRVEDKGQAVALSPQKGYVQAQAKRRAQLTLRGAGFARLLYERCATPKCGEMITTDARNRRVTYPLPYCREAVASTLPDSGGPPRSFCALELPLDADGKYVTWDVRVSADLLLHASTREFNGKVGSSRVATLEDDGSFADAARAAQHKESETAAALGHSAPDEEGTTVIPHEVRVARQWAPPYVLYGGFSMDGLRAVPARDPPALTYAPGVFVGGSFRPHRTLTFEGNAVARWPIRSTPAAGVAAKIQYRPWRPVRLSVRTLVGTQWLNGAPQIGARSTFHMQYALRINRYFQMRPAAGAFFRVTTLNNMTKLYPGVVDPMVRAPFLDPNAMGVRPQLWADLNPMSELVFRAGVRMATHSDFLPWDPDWVECVGRGAWGRGPFAVMGYLQWKHFFVDEQQVQANQRIKAGFSTAWSHRLGRRVHVQMLGGFEWVSDVPWPRALFGLAFSFANQPRRVGDLSPLRLPHFWNDTEVQ